MRLSELAGKRIINLYDGEIIGNAGDSDLLIDSASGLITEIVLPPGRGQRAARRPLSIPWSCVRKIGPEVIVVDMEY
ncbi:MAG: YlmC/YmxH family sporulation protein [Firmicutes bacterium]|nr:YlmC/YmxH family sporulation protein [Bacillota bacterium]